MKHQPGLCNFFRLVGDRMRERRLSKYASEKWALYEGVRVRSFSFTADGHGRFDLEGMMKLVSEP